MKKLIILLLFAHTAILTNAQTAPPRYLDIANYFKWLGGAFTQGLAYKTGNGAPTDTPTLKMAHKYWDSTNHRGYTFDPAIKIWLAEGSSSGSDSINLEIKDTTITLSGFVTTLTLPNGVDFTPATATISFLSGPDDPAAKYFTQVFNTGSNSIQITWPVAPIGTFTFRRIYLKPAS